MKNLLIFLMLTGLLGLGIGCSSTGNKASDMETQMETTEEGDNEAVEESQEDEQMSEDENTEQEEMTTDEESSEPEYDNSYESEDSESDSEDMDDSY